MIQANPALFAKLAAYPRPTPPSADCRPRPSPPRAAGPRGPPCSPPSPPTAAITGVIAVAPELATGPVSAQLTALSKVPPQVIAYLKAHAAAVQKAAAHTPGQWKTWYWVCFGGIIFFLLSIPLLRGRWTPSDARRDEEAHEAMVPAELAKLHTEGHVALPGSADPGSAPAHLDGPPLVAHR